MRDRWVRRALPVAVVASVLGAVVGVIPPVADAAAEGRPVPADWTGPPFTDELVVGGLTQSLSAEFLPDGRMLVLGKRGTVTLLEPASGATSVVLTIPAVNADGERGALDLVASPTFASDRHFYVYYSGTDLRMHVDRFTLGSPAATSASQVPVWVNPGPTINQTATGHLGGSLNFGRDGMLYISIGETVQASNAQQLTNPFGKVLRIRPDGTVPADNPFADGAGPNVDEIWAYGFRNPFRASVDPATGLLWVGDVGGNYHKNAYEEINVVARGGNYGWSVCEGPVGPPKNGAACPPGVTGPVASYAHQPDLRTGENASITGGEVYRGTRYAPLQGAYVYADYARREIRYAPLASPSAVATDGVLMSTGQFQPTWIGAGPDGAIYYVHFGYSGSTGQVRRLQWSGATSRPPVIASASATPVAGAAPLAVSFAASAADPDGTPVSYRWLFGDGTAADGATSSHTYRAPGRYGAQLEVRSGGDTARSAVIDIEVGDPPVAAITSPADGTTFKAGDTITIRGTGSDDRTLPAGALRWAVAFVHDDHTHPVMEDVSGTTISLPIATTGHGYEGATSYLVTLTVTDADGLQSSTSIRVFPRKVATRIETNLPSGGTVVVDGITHGLPFTIDAVEGFRLPVEVPPVACAGGDEWRFEGWSNGAARSSTLVIGSEAVTLTATYRNAGRTSACAPTAPSTVGGTVVGAATTPSGARWLGLADGRVVATGGAPHHGDMGGRRLNAPVVAMAATPPGGGYWLLGADGGIFSFGDAAFHGSTGGMRLNQPVLGIAADPLGRGYWTVAADGGVFSFGVPFHGSTGAMRLNQPVVGMAATASGGGYWLVARDGGVFAFGDAAFSGSTGAIRLNQPIVAMVADQDGRGYWLVAADGGVFAFDAAFHGSGVGRLAAGDRVVSAVSRAGGGYALVAASGAVLDFGPGTG